MKITEAHARNGQFPLFKIGGEKLNVKIRTINETEDWLDEVAAIDDLEQQIDAELDPKKRRAIERECRQKIVDAVFSYDPDLDRKKVEAHFTPLEIMNALEDLRNELDPFVARRKRKEREGLELLNSLDPATRTKMLEMMEAKTLKL